LSVNVIPDWVGAFDWRSMPVRPTLGHNMPFGHLSAPPDGSMDIRTNPYAYLAIPLTLLSAWLLLSKPRAKKSEPIAPKPATDSLT